ncbi:MAG: hypothetical protein CMM58_01525 [Rhodospirillaceae bacterium]|nr:hypothetical protein [Rhodospirillaceae bacterium]
MEENQDAEGSSPVPPPKAGPKTGLTRTVVRLFLLILVPAIALVLGANWYEKTGRFVETENAYVKTNVIAISADIDGRVTDVLVDENQNVSKGALLFKLDPNSYSMEIQMAESQLEKVRHNISALQAEYYQILAEIEEKKASVVYKKANLAYYKREAKRQRMLIKKSITTRAKLDDAESKLDEAEFKLLAATREVATRKQKIKTVIARLGGDPNRRFDEHPDFIKAETQLSLAKINLGYTEVQAPIAGVVTRLKLEPGEWVEAGEPAFGIISTDRVWIEANLKETQLTHVREGQKTIIEIDAYPDVIWEGEVGSISPATGAEFSVLPPQNASGNWVKVVQRLPVRIEIKSVSNKPPLRAGMTSTVSIDTQHQRKLWSTIKSSISSIQDGLNMEKTQ